MGVEELQAFQNLWNVIARLGIKNHLGNIDFTKVPLAVLDNSHRLPPETSHELVLR